MNSVFCILTTVNPCRLLYSCSLFDLFLNFLVIFDFRERVRGGERGRETSGVTGNQTGDLWFAGQHPTEPHLLGSCSVVFERKHLW